MRQFHGVSWLVSSVRYFQWAIWRMGHCKPYVFLPLSSAVFSGSGMAHWGRRVFSWPVPGALEGRAGAPVALSRCIAASLSAVFSM